MSALATFIDHHNALIIDEEKTHVYQLVNLSDDQVWETFASPVTEEVVLAAIANTALGLPTGRHSLKLQAVSKSAVRGQTMLTVDGKSAAARKSVEESLTQARATAMNVATAEQQLTTMNTRLQDAMERTREAEERAGNAILDQYKAADMVHKMLMDRDEAELRRDEREARMRTFQTVAEALAPVLGEMVKLGSEWAEHKTNEWRRQWAQEAANASESKPSTDTTGDDIEGD